MESWNECKQKYKLPKLMRHRESGAKKEIFMSISAHIKKQQKCKTNNLTLPFVEQ
jgi:hypothetical protein